MAAETIIRALFVLVALALVGLILLQRGKGADIGASFGSGGSQTLFGAAGATSLLVKVTAVLAALFFISSFSLAFIAKQRADSAASVDVPDAAVDFADEFPDAPDAGFVDGVDDVPVVDDESLAPANDGDGGDGAVSGPRP